MVQNKKKTAQAGKLKVTLLRSVFGRVPSHAECVKGLGLRRIRHSVVVDNNPCTRGMIQKVWYLLKVEEA
jgi:large subunit ribosomal protein L30